MDKCKMVIIVNMYFLIKVHPFAQFLLWFFSLLIFSSFSELCQSNMNPLLSRELSFDRRNPGR